MIVSFCQDFYYKFFMHNTLGGRKGAFYRANILVNKITSSFSNDEAFFNTKNSRIHYLCIII